jgi:dihydrodipicolinate synthase/N-acetylneuraminate lyase
MRTLALDKAMRAMGTFPANLKAAMNVLGRPGGYVRPPLLNFSEAEQARVGAILDELQIGRETEDAA